MGRFRSKFTENESSISQFLSQFLRNLYSSLSKISWIKSYISKIKVLDSHAAPSNYSFSFSQWIKLPFSNSQEINMYFPSYQYTHIPPPTTTSFIKAPADFKFTESDAFMLKSFQCVWYLQRMRPENRWFIERRYCIWTTLRIREKSSVLLTVRS